MAFSASTYGVDLINMHPHGIQLCEKHPFVHLSNSKIRRFERMIRAGSQMTNSRPVVNKPEIDFSDPDWKRHFQEDFDKRFNLPHLRDILAIKPRPTTFSLKSRLSHFFYFLLFFFKKKHLSFLIIKYLVFLQAKCLSSVECFSG